KGVGEVSLSQFFLFRGQQGGKHNRVLLALFVFAPHSCHFGSFRSSRSQKNFSLKKPTHLHFSVSCASVSRRYGRVGFGVGKAKTCRFCHHFNHFSVILCFVLWQTKILHVKR
ncbi:MAG: hypothetical protein II170_07330, partial [Bacteroidaceae bacterium]|nr:hypothetical protein [Bacteroidaceae bacterium]